MLIRKRLGIFFILLALSPLFVHAEETKIFADLKKRYLTLRNTDFHVERAPEWVALAKDWEKYLKEALPFTKVQMNEAVWGYANTPSGQRVFAEYALARIYFELAQRDVENQEIFSRAEDKLRYFVRDWAKHELAFEAEFALLELREHRLSVEQFKQILAETKQRYKSDSRVVRLDQFLTAIDLRKTTRQKKDKEKSIVVDKSRKLIVIDAGHGGEDEGALSQKYGYREKEKTLEWARDISRELEKHPKLETRFTRTHDQFLPLGERVEIANDFEADLFLSIHFNASPKRNLSGFQLFYLDNASDAASQALVDREGAFIAAGEYTPRRDLMFMLSDFIQRAKIDKSIRLAKKKSKLMTEQLGGFGLRNGGVKTAPFYVLVGVHMPCILVEVLYLDNPQDAKLLQNDAFKKKAVSAIAEAVKQYFFEKKK